MNRKQKIYLFLIAAFNMLALVIGAAIILHGQQRDITLYDLPLYNTDGIYDEDCNTFSTDYPEADYWFMGTTDSLLPGIYTIKVDYSTDSDYYMISCSSGTDGNSYPAVYAESHQLSWLSHTLSYRIWVNNKLDHLDVRIDCGGGGAGHDIFEMDSFFSLEKIEITRNYRTSIFYRVIKLAAMLLACNGIICVLWNREKVRENIYVILGLACILVVSSLGVMGNFPMTGHDTWFHYARIIGLADGLLDGSFPVKIQPGWLHGYGYASSVCYGDVLLYFPAVLYIFGVPLVHAYKIYLFLVNLGTLCISYTCFKQISRNRYIGVACSALYCLAVSRILNIYLRTAVGEYSAFMFFPWILLGMQKIYVPDSEKDFKNGWLFLCLGMTGIIQTHVLSVELVCLFLAVLMFMLAGKLSVQVFLTLVKSVFVTLMLNIGFLIPFLDYASEDLSVYATRDSYSIQHFGLSIYELFSVGASATGRAQDSLSGLSGRIPESLGCAMYIAVLLSIIVLVKYPGQDWKGKKQCMLSAVLGGIALFMSTCYFPWNRLAAVPGVRTAAASIQFPWRLLSIAVPLLTYMACHTFAVLKDVMGRRKLYVLMAGICMVSAFQALFCMDLIVRNTEDRAIPYDGHYLMNLSRIVSGGEYLLADTDTNLTWTELDVMGENIQTDALERKGTQMSVCCQAGENAWIEFPLFAYKYYQCMDVQTGKCYPVIRGANNKVHVDLPDYYQGTLKVFFEEPWYWRGAELVSCIAFIVIMTYIGKAFLFHRC